MKVLVTSETRFDATPDGCVWTATAFSRDFWKRYLTVFDEVEILARVRPTSCLRPGMLEVTDSRIRVRPVPHFHGPEEFIFRSRSVFRSTRNLVGPDTAVIVRGAAVLPWLATRHCRVFGIEVVGDPWEVFSPGANPHPARPLFRHLFYRLQTRMCARAAAVAYVTERALQARYPAASQAFTTHYSNVELPPEAFVSEHRLARTAPYHLVTVGSLETPYKGIDVLLSALARVRAGGDDIRLTVIGDGACRVDLEAQARRLSLTPHVDFRGRLPAGPCIRDVLDTADLFVLPSRTEGLPRAMLEAMARGLPCIGTRVGGIPEILDDEELVPPEEPQALAACIRRLLASPDARSRLSKRNLTRARDYSNHVLDERRRRFYEHVRAATASQHGSSLH